MLLVEHWEVHLLNKYRNHNWEKGIEQISKTLTILFLHKAAETLTKSNQHKQLTKTKKRKKEHNKTFIYINYYNNKTYN